MEPLISVIVPVYNVAEYLPRCIDSILSQTYNSFEIILVNDGSTDGSSEICDQYAKTDKRINVIHQSNSGVSIARNRGLDAAGGEWISFVDSDDWIDMQMLEMLCEAAKGKEMAVCGYAVHNKGVVKDYSFHELPNTMTGIDCLKYRGNTQTEFSIDSVCGAIISKSLIDTTPELRFDSVLHHCEDTLFVIQLLFRLNAMAYIPKPLYNYCLRNNSATTSSINDKQMTAFHALKRIIDLLETELPQAAELQRFIYTSNAKYMLYKAITAEKSGRNYISQLVSEIRFYIPFHLKSKKMKVWKKTAIIFFLLFLRTILYICFKLSGNWNECAV
jgi:glycosyltransferase involved in cell wall biosynthesis